MASLPWKRKTSSTGAKVPAEVEQYYESSRKERVGIAWLLALGTLILTLLIAAGIFLAGRWAYNRIFNNNEGEAPAATNSQNDSNDTQVNNPPSAGDDQSGDANRSSGSNTDNNQGQNPSSGQTGDPSSQPTQPSPAPQTPSTGGDEIPRTGPDGDE